MEKLQIGKKLQIHCYKHNGKIHRSWDEAVILDVKKDYIVFGNCKTKVIEADGRTWKTKEPAIMYFYRNSWFNIIGQLKNKGICYYCNMATPFVIENDTIKYIDYDLDLRVFSEGAFKVLDKDEYAYHKKKMKYPDEIDVVLKSELTTLIEMYRQGMGPFRKENINYYYEIYKKLKKYNFN